MSPYPDDLTGMKDDMTAFIEGQGMRRFFGYVESEEIPSILWESGPNPDGWKDFVELAKAAGAPFLTMHSWALDREELERLMQRLNEGDYTSEEDLEDARWLKTYVGKTGFVQLGWAYQGCVFVYEASADWYDHYQRLRELADDVGGFVIDEPDQDEER
jgi:sugar/nucleoside kinase (ribokinase family)